MRLTYYLIGSLLAFSTLARGGDWADFRGPFFNGHVTQDDKPVGLPLNWSETQNVKWKTAIPYRGWSTPVVMGGQVWLTTATEDGHDFFVICVEAETGKVRLQEKLFHSDNPEPLGNPTNCYASPSPVIEAGRVYVHFGSYGTACLDTASGKTIWQRTDLPCRHYRGPASSPILFEDLLILTMDGVDTQYLVALDKKTGRTVWKTNRSTDFGDLGPDGMPSREGDLRKGFSTPVIIDLKGKPLMISSGSKAIFGYDPRTGQERWKIQHPSHTSVIRPVYVNGLVIFVTGMGKAELWAVRPDGAGDVTASNVVWKSATRMVAKTASPVVIGDLLYMVTDGGKLSCVEVATGQEIWKDEIGGMCAASPIVADGRIYFFDQAGKGTVIKPGRKFEVLATNTLESGCMASPVVAGKAIFLRTKTHLYRIEESGAAGR